jgi:uncharacterized protein (DUF4415 family)
VKPHNRASRHSFLLAWTPRDFPKAKRGPVISVPKGKTRITIRLDEDVIAWFRTQVERAGGGNYQSLINDALRQYIANAKEPLEETLRRVVREEMRRADQTSR